MSAETTWDGLPVAGEAPFACCVVVWRRGSGGGREFLVLHRAHAEDPEGDWAWTPPSGARQPGEEPDAAAARELREETGLDLASARIASPSPDVALYLAEAPPDTEIVLDEEHDDACWLPLAEAETLCLPGVVAAGLRAAAGALD